MPTQVVASREEFLTQAAIDYSRVLVEDERYIGRSGLLPQIAVQARRFAWEKFDKSLYNRFNASVGPKEATKVRDQNSELVQDSITKHFRFGATYVQDDINAIDSETIVQQRKTYEATRVTALDYEISLNSVFNSGTQSGAATALWNTAAGDPVTDIRAGAGAIALGMIPDTFMFSLRTWRAMITNQSFRDYVKGTANDGRIDYQLAAEAIGDIVGLHRPVNIKVLNASYNSESPNVNKTFTEANAFTQNTCYMYVSGQSEDPFAPAAVKEFYDPEQEGVFVSGDPDNDDARNMTVVTHKLVRKGILTADELLYRITNTI